MSGLAKMLRVLLVGSVPAAASAAVFTIDWFSPTAGGALQLSGGAFEADVSVGTNDAGGLFGGEFEWDGGFLAVSLPAPETCAEDLDGDNLTSSSDLAILLANWERADPRPADGDIDGDGDVDLTDLAMLLSSFGTSCPP
ncbi:MAG: hypothetical protein D6744_04950 [Planctomycetota bacterium]|nr:MAG: hypothetical protein D6744_04950 [Planctomycetota bacterium]